MAGGTLVPHLGGLISDGRIGPQPDLPINAAGLVDHRQRFPQRRVALQRKRLHLLERERPLQVCCRRVQLAFGLVRRLPDETRSIKRPVDCVLEGFTPDG